MAARRAVTLSLKPHREDLGEFARAAAAWLGLPGGLVSRESAGDTYSFSETRTRWGTSARGIELVDRTDETDRGHYTMSYRLVRVKTYGFGPETALDASFGEDSAKLSVVAGEEAVVQGILNAFEAAANGGRPAPPPLS